MTTKRKAFYFTLKEFFPHCNMLEVKYAMYNNIVVNNLFRLCQLMSYIRLLADEPVIITSGYRDSSHNALVGGTSTSQHMTGSACDFQIKSKRYDELFELIKNNVEFGQLIIYPTFIHISLPTNKVFNQILIEKNGKITSL